MGNTVDSCVASSRQNNKINCFISLQDSWELLKKIVYHNYSIVKVNLTTIKDVLDQQNSGILMDLMDPNNLNGRQTMAARGPQ